MKCLVGGKEMLNKIILITGGTGSWGRELIKQLLEKSPKEIRFFQETKRFSLKCSNSL